MKNASLEDITKTSMTSGWATPVPSAIRRAGHGYSESFTSGLHRRWSVAAQTLTPKSSSRSRPRPRPRHGPASAPMASQEVVPLGTGKAWWNRLSRRRRPSTICVDEPSPRLSLDSVGVRSQKCTSFIDMGDDWLGSGIRSPLEKDAPLNGHRRTMSLVHRRRRQDTKTSTAEQRFSWTVTIIHEDDDGEPASEAMKTSTFVPSNAPAVAYGPTTTSRMGVEATPDPFSKDPATRSVFFILDAFPPPPPLCPVRARSSSPQPSPPQSAFSSSTSPLPSPPPPYSSQPEPIIGAKRNSRIISRRPSTAPSGDQTEQDRKQHRRSWSASLLQASNGSGANCLADFLLRPVRRAEAGRPPRPS